jgi:ferredoxin
MALWFLRGLRRGVVTTRYPRGAPDPWTRKLPTPPVIDASLLDAETADRLVAICPSSALRRNANVLTYDVGACTACGRCLALAPQAIRPSGEFELAATARAQLIKHLSLGPAPQAGFAEGDP